MPSCWAAAGEPISTGWPSKSSSPLSGCMTPEMTLSACSCRRRCRRSGPRPRPGRPRSSRPQRLDVAVGLHDVARLEDRTRSRARGSAGRRLDSPLRLSRSGCRRQAWRIGLPRPDEAGRPRAEGHERGLTRGAGRSGSDARRRSSARRRSRSGPRTRPEPINSLRRPWSRARRGSRRRPRAGAAAGCVDGGRRAAGTWIGRAASMSAACRTYPSRGEGAPRRGDAAFFHSNTTDMSLGSCSSIRVIPVPIVCSVPAGTNSTSPADRHLVQSAAASPRSPAR